MGFLIHEGLRTEAGIGADDGARAYFCAFDVAEFAYLYAAVDDGIADDAVRTDARAAFDDAGAADLAGAVDLGAGLHHGQRADADAGKAVHHHAGSEDGGVAALLEQFFGGGQLYGIVHAEQSIPIAARAFGPDAAHVHAFGQTEGHEVGDVVFAALIVIAEFGQEAAH